MKCSFGVKEKALTRSVYKVNELGGGRSMSKTSCLFFLMKLSLSRLLIINLSNVIFNVSVAAQ